MTRPRVLWVSPSAPDHEGGGDQLRQAHLLDQVAAHFDVHLIAPSPVRDQKVAACLSGMDVVDVPPRRPARMVDRGRHLMARDSWIVRRAEPIRRGLQAAVSQRAREADVVMVEHLELARLHDSSCGVPWLLTLHLLHSRHTAQLAATVEGRQRWFWEVDARKAARLERWACDTYDTVVAMSVEDGAVLPGNCIVVPNGVDLSERPAPLPVEPRIVFTGSFDFHPNTDGIRWFLDACWDRVRAAVPGASLTLVGRRPGERFAARATAAEGVTLEPDVPVIAPSLDAARVVIVPIRIGSGTRVKALQGMAAGRPVVGTSIGLEGLGLEDGRTALIADDPDAFADAVVAACTDDELAASLASLGRAHVEKHFGWAATAAPLLDALTRLADGRVKS